MYEHTSTLKFLEAVFGLPTLASVNHLFDQSTPGGPNNEAAGGSATGPPAPPRDDMPEIEASPAFGRNGVIVVVYDEDERAGGLAGKYGFGQGGHVVCAILSPLAVPGSYGGRFYHYSLLRTVEDGLRLPGHVGYANDVTAINTIWGAPSS